MQVDHDEHVLLYLDLDKFKIINDTCGHQAGDEMLRKVSRAMHVEIRKHDLLARIGGDEFAIVLEHCTAEQAQHIANNILERIQEIRLDWQNTIFKISVSIGIFSILHENIDTTEIIRLADTACYRAKKAGRNCIHVWQ